MITSLDLRNWQSLVDLNLPLGRFTVVVGASSSGKTALVRALRALASNVRGTSAITRGASAASITARLSDGARVTLAHAGGSWRYQLLDPEDNERTFTKLAGSVPPEVTAALRISPAATGAPSLHFAGQFDRPFLLDESGSAVAAQLGQLTNVDRILGAVREANRQRAALAATLRTREADLADLTARAGAFADLPDRLTACERAEKIAEAATHTDTRVRQLQSLLDVLEGAQQALTDAAPPAPPSLEALDAILERRARFLGLLRDKVNADTELRRATDARDTAARVLTDQDTALHHALREAAVCPTCGRSVTE